MGMSGCGSTRRKTRSRAVRMAGVDSTQVRRSASSQLPDAQLSRSPRWRKHPDLNKRQSEICDDDRKVMDRTGVLMHTDKELKGNES